MNREVESITWFGAMPDEQTLNLVCGHTIAMTKDHIEKLQADAMKKREPIYMNCHHCDDAARGYVLAKKLQPIPIAEAQRVADKYGYDQVVIYGRRCHDSEPPHGEHLTTFGRNKQHCEVAARIGDTLKRIMGWQSNKEQWVEREAIKAHAETDCTGRMWQDLSYEQQEAFREPFRAEWDQD